MTAAKFEVAYKEGIKAILMVLPNVPNEICSNTPERSYKAFQELTCGYDQKPSTILSKRFDIGKASDQVILVKDMPFVSLCAHHLLPFHGTAAIAYIPKKYVIDIPNEPALGLSKLARLLRCRSRRLQTQEQLGYEIATDLETYLQPSAVGVVITSSHDCMTARGIESQGLMTTSVLLGAFRDNESARAELMMLLSHR